MPPIDWCWKKGRACKRRNFEFTGAFESSTRGRFCKERKNIFASACENARGEKSNFVGARQNTRDCHARGYQQALKKGWHLTLVSDKQNICRANICSRNLKILIRTYPQLIHSELKRTALMKVKQKLDNLLLRINQCLSRSKLRLITL